MKKVLIMSAIVFTVLSGSVFARNDVNVEIKPNRLLVENRQNDSNQHISFQIEQRDRMDRERFDRERFDRERFDRERFDRERFERERERERRERFERERERERRERFERRHRRHHHHHHRDWR